MSPNVFMQFNLSQQIWFTGRFLKLCHNNTDSWLHKVRQLLKNETENSYYKVITECDRSLLQSASGITKRDRLLLKSASGITKCNS